MNVPFFNYPDIYISNQKSFLEIFDNVCRSGGFIMQKELLSFEKKIADYTGSKYALGVANATDALEMLIYCSGIEKDSEVIICSHTMIATASAIHSNGAIPIPVEMGEDHLIDPSAIEKNITSKTQAIIPTQLNGRTANMDIIIDIANKNNLIVIEDSAQALGSTFKSKHAGTFGVGGCISFYPAKLLGCFGDGGMILTNHKEVYEKLVLIRDHGRDSSTGDINLWGRNSRLDNFQAAILEYQFKNFENVINRRRSIASTYNDKLKVIDEIVLPPAPNQGDHFDVFQNYEIRIKNRDLLKNYLSQNNIGTLVQWGGKAIHHFNKLGFNQQLHFTDMCFDQMLMLPINMSIKDNEVNYVCEKILDFYEK